MSTHVWMLSDGEPTGTEDIAGYLQAQLQDPYIVQTSGLLRALLVWWLSWLWSRRMQTSYRQLPGPSPVQEHRIAQATLLARQLGPGYTCQPVFRYHAPDIEKAAAGVGRGDRVVLLPMLPHRCGAVNSAVVNANTRLSERRAEVTSVPSYPDFTGYVDAVAETVRAGLADFPVTCHTSYEVLFCAQLPAEFRRGEPEPEHHDEVQRTVAAVVAAVGLVRPHHIAYTSSVARIRNRTLSAHAVLRDQCKRGVPAVLLVPLSLTCDRVGTLVQLDQELGALAEEAGMTFVRAETVATRPTFIRALADLVREAEREAEWAG